MPAGPGRGQKPEIVSAAGIESVDPWMLSEKKANFTALSDFCSLHCEVPS